MLLEVMVVLADVGTDKLLCPTRPPATLVPLELPWLERLFNELEVLCKPVPLVLVEEVDPLELEVLEVLELLELLEEEPFWLLWLLEPLCEEEPPRLLMALCVFGMVCVPDGACPVVLDEAVEFVVVVLAEDAVACGAIFLLPRALMIMSPNCSGSLNRPSVSRGS